MAVGTDRVPAASPREWRDKLPRKARQPSFCDSSRFTHCPAPLDEDAGQDHQRNRWNELCRQEDVAEDEKRRQQGEPFRELIANPLKLSQRQRYNRRESKEQKALRVLRHQKLGD